MWMRDDWRLLVGLVFLVVVVVGCLSLGFLHRLVSALLVEQTVAHSLTHLFGLDLTSRAFSFF